MDAPFTKEELAAIANEVGYAVDEGPSAATSRMRAGICWRVGLSETEDAATGRHLAKDELQAIADHLDVQVD